MVTEYGLQSKITSVDTILLVHPSRYYMFDKSMELVGPLFKGEEYHESEEDKKFIATITANFEESKKNFKGLEQRFDTSRIYSIVNDNSAVIQFGNFICKSNNSEILSKSDVRDLLKQGTDIMLGGGYWNDCYAMVFNELVLGFLYPGFLHRKEVSGDNFGDKLRIVAPANYIFNSEGNTIDRVLKIEGKEEFLKLFLDEYLSGHYQQKYFKKRISPFSYTLLFDGEVIVEHKTNSKKEFSLEVLSSI